MTKKMTKYIMWFVKFLVFFMNVFELLLFLIKYFFKTIPEHIIEENDIKKSMGSLKKKKKENNCFN